MADPTRTTGTDRVKRGLAEMLRGGVIMDVVTPEQAVIAEEAGAVAVEVRGGAKGRGAPIGRVRGLAGTGRLPVPLFWAGGIATPADAALVMQLGAEAVFVGSGIFKSADPGPRAKAIVEATAHHTDAHIVAKVSRGLGEPMRGTEADKVEVKLSERGW